MTNYINILNNYNTSKINLSDNPKPSIETLDHIHYVITTYINYRINPTDSSLNIYLANLSEYLKYTCSITNIPDKFKNDFYYNFLNYIMPYKLNR